MQVAQPLQKESSLQVKTTKALNKNDTKRLTNAMVKYDDLLKEYKGSGKLWEDPYFPADNASLFTFPGKNPTRTWKRPKEINEDAVLIFRGPNRTDVKISVKAEFERSRFVSALISITDYEPLFKNVVPVGQDFEFNYIGAFRFRFFKFGKWREVIVDDRLPMLDDKLDFAFSSSKFEFWAPLVEKAYAKMYGTYQDLMEISQEDAMEELTAGICERFDLSVAPPTLNADMFEFWKQSSLLCCINEKPGTTGGIQGLQSHNIIFIMMLTPTDQKTETVLRIRNPNGTSETGTSSGQEQSDYYTKLMSPEEKRKYNTVEEGEFWMAYPNFLKLFTHLIVCHLGPESIDDGINDQIRWNIDLHRGSWVKNVNCGGSRKNLDYYSSNPQYMVDVLGDDTAEKNQNATLIVSLTQMDWRRMNFDYNGIGFDIYKVKEKGNGRLDKEFFKINVPIIPTTSYTNKRNICSHHTLSVGQYAIVPSKLAVNQDGKFLLRIGTRKLKTAEIDEASGRIDISAEMEKRIVELTLDTLDTELEVIFKHIGGADEFIDATKLTKVLNAILAKDAQCIKMKCFEGFTLDDGRSMISLYDENRNGRMEFLEFGILFRNLRIWKTVFVDFDTDSNGVFSSVEYRKALNYCGVKVNNDVFKAMVIRYANPETGHITFEDFVMSLIRLSNSFNYLGVVALNSYHEEIFNPYQTLGAMMSL